jgi:hypothetical protein
MALPGLPALWSPSAREHEVRAAADVWRGASVRLACTAADLHAAAAMVTTANEGRAVEAFARHWEGLAGPGGRHLEELVVTCRALADALDAYADELAAVRRELAEVAAEIAATLAVGAALTWATAGVSTAVTGGTVAALTMEAAALGATLATRASAIARLVGLHATIGALEGIATYAVVEPLVAAAFAPNEDPLRAYTRDGLVAAVVTGAALPGWQGVRALRAAPLGPGPAADALARPATDLPWWRDLARSARTLEGVAVDLTVEVPLAVLDRRGADGP